MTDHASPTTPRWVSALIDVPSASYDETVRFWSAITGYEISEPRGNDGEFASLLSPDADDHLRVQRIGDGPPGIHLDLHVDDPRRSRACG